jgi:poly-gamma-glutamate synthesis protein (capsule biosynthesis protein)
VSLDAPAALIPSWERLLAAHPLPASIFLVRAASGEAQAADRIDVRLGASTGDRVVEKILQAPVAQIWETPPAATMSGVRSGSLRVLPLESITLPDTALPVDGLYADQPGYPLYAEVAVGVHSNDPALRAWYGALPAAHQWPDPALITWIEAVGDIMPARGVDAALLAPGGLERVFGGTLPILRAADFLLGNLEATASTSGGRVRKSYNFHFVPAALEGLAQAGFAYLSLANNHSYDFGRRGFVETLQALASAGIGTSGAGQSQALAEAPFVLRKRDTEIRVLSFGAFPVDPGGFDGKRDARASESVPGMLWLDEQGVAEASRAFSRDSFNIALVHGGDEWSSRPNPEQKHWYRALIDAGADLVVGSHPHVLQGMEARGGRLIAYSLGNFIFPGMEDTPGGQDSVILKLGILEGRIFALQAIPVRLAGTTVRRAKGDAAAATLRSLTIALGSGN